MSSLVRFSTVRLIPGVLLGGSLIVLLSSVPYLTPSGRHPFLAERPWLAVDALWRVSLTLHVASGVFCLPVGLVLLSRRCRERRPSLHRRLGRGYAVVALGSLVPTGIYLSFYSKAGWASGFGFLLSACATGAALAYSIMAVVRASESLHRDYAIRAYAQVASAITFRIVHLVFQLVELPYTTNYVASVWLSVLGNAVLAEIWIAFTYIERREFNENARVTRVVPVVHPARR